MTSVKWTILVVTAVGVALIYSTFVTGKTAATASQSFKYKVSQDFDKAKHDAWVVWRASAGYPPVVHEPRGSWDDAYQVASR